MHIHSVALNAIGWPVEDWFSPAFGKRSWHRTRDSPQELVWDFPPRKNRASQTQTPLKRGETSWLWESLTASSRSSTISFPDKRWRSSTRSPQWMEKQELPMKCAGLAACCCYDPGMMSHILQKEKITVSYLFTRCFPHHVLHNPSKLALSLCFLAPLGLYLRISKVKALSVVAEQILIRQWTTFQWCPLPESFPITRNVDDLLQNLSAAWCILSWMLKSYICRSPRLVNCYITVANVRVFFFVINGFFDAWTSTCFMARGG